MKALITGYVNAFTKILTDISAMDPKCKSKDLNKLRDLISKYLIIYRNMDKHISNDPNYKNELTGDFFTSIYGTKLSDSDSEQVIKYFIDALCEFLDVDLLLNNLQEYKNYESTESTIN